MKSVRALSHLERNERCSNLRLFLYAKPFYKRYIDFVQNKEQWVCVENSNFLIIDIHQFPSELKAKSTSTVVNIFECLCLCSYTNFLRRINYILYIFVIINQSKKYNMYIILKFRFTWFIFIWPLVTINIVKDLLTFCLLEQIYFL